jgi:hypothetical protein
MDGAAPLEKGGGNACIQGTLELQEMAVDRMNPLPLPLPPLPPLLLLKPLLALLFLDASQRGGLSGFPFPIGKGGWGRKFYRRCGSCLYGHGCFCRHHIVIR